MRAGLQQTGRWHWRIATGFQGPVVGSRPPQPQAKPGRFLSLAGIPRSRYCCQVLVICCHTGRPRTRPRFRQQWPTGLQQCRNGRVPRRAVSSHGDCHAGLPLVWGAWPPFRFIIPGNIAFWPDRGGTSRDCQQAVGAQERCGGDGDWAVGGEVLQSGIRMV